MHYFLLTYEQLSGVLTGLEEFPADAVQAAVQRRFELETKHRDDPNIEVVLIGAPSLEHVKVTHGRYFRPADELLGA